MKGSELSASVELLSAAVCLANSAVASLAIIAALDLFNELSSSIYTWSHAHKVLIIAVAFLRGRRLLHSWTIFEGGVYIKKYSTRSKVSNNTGNASTIIYMHNTDTFMKESTVPEKKDAVQSHVSDTSSLSSYP